jgi:hypothetical protein
MLWAELFVLTLLPVVHGQLFNTINHWFKTVVQGAHALFNPLN